ncbi:GNAT family N-acetyltransferase [Synechococcus sp. CS-1332]|uniref:GNAT family N-acetyltransferase n=1 Tax=Synechococcus sp. CS-1332 TaxID=2847972 RepID=UPI00223BA3CB|nr:GNAT family N-acetyltransferase [Synechococcus sp. CS-1332]MCT0207576.1 GNAT family N-acetyltransferase [Synechococcus sp. CS-1332]
MNEVVIRHVEPDDYQPIISVVDEWWGGRPMAEMLPKLFFVHFRSTSFTAVVDGQVVAFLIGFVSQTYPDQAYVHFLGVHPARRGEGLGRLLYERFFARAASLGCRTVHCVTAPVNRNSIAFHRRMGFSLLESDFKIDGVPVAVGYDGEAEDRVIFTKNLDTLDIVR